MHLTLRRKLPSTTLQICYTFTIMLKSQSFDSKIYKSLLKVPQLSVRARFYFATIISRLEFRYRAPCVLGNEPKRPVHLIEQRSCSLEARSRSIRRKVGVPSAVVNCQRFCYNHREKLLLKMPLRKKVCIIGSGNWGSTIAKIIGKNVLLHDYIDDQVNMYVYEEIIDGKKLTDIINETHENIKYLPGHILPSNVVAVPDITVAALQANIVVFVVPHQFVPGLCESIKGIVNPTAVALSLIKGFASKPGGGIRLISEIISDIVGIPCSVLMGANLAGEVADEKFCETTIGCNDDAYAPIFKDIIETDYFRVVIVPDVAAVEVCGALKNIVACGAGFIDGMDLGDNTKAAVIRLGLMEIIKFVDVFYEGSHLSTFFQSCGVADLVTTCYGGRNRRVSEAFIKSNKSIAELETEMLKGQKLQGPITAEEVNFMLKNMEMEKNFPLFTAVHKICKGEMAATEFINCLRHHPEHNATYGIAPADV